ncbi:hypothetical protein [Halopiger goleimassiliensis]|uniref:hypothetical protein n=1 Tax=Halopiger goleimassiliensis TaxID=1293048 RepID=UPI000677F030|nr:hypothetical protein [Halopiger goleimassiliensis]
MSDTEPDGEYVPPDDPDVDYLMHRLETLEETVDEPDEREEVRRTMSAARRLAHVGGFEERIQKFTGRDVAEAFVGGIAFSLPMLVEDGVFEIARWFLQTTVAGVPVFFVANVAFVVFLTIGLIYWSDIRDVQVTDPLFGVIPRRLVGVLAVSFLTATFLLFLWGRHTADDPAGTLEVLSRITVVWSAAAFGAALGDILPGESRGHDLVLENIDEIVSREDE